MRAGVLWKSGHLLQVGATAWEEVGEAGREGKGAYSGNTAAGSALTTEARGTTTPGSGNDRPL